MAVPAIFDPIVNAPRPQKIGLGIFGVIILGVGAYFLLISPIQERIAALDTQNAALQREVAQNRAIVADLERYRREAVELERKLAVLQDRLPTEKEMPPLYRTLSDAAFESGLLVSLFQPREPRVRDYYSEIPITITADAGYHELADFFTKVARLPRVVTLGDVKLTTSAGKSKMSLRADLTLATYVYRPVGSPPAPKAPGAAAGAK
jgi:type IV pilus assembly protein PilO